MSYIIVGLGNPGEEYINTRHNMGRIVVEKFHDWVKKKNDFSEWKENTKKTALISKGKIGKHAVTLVLPEKFMNKSGVPLRDLAVSAKKAEKLVVVYDDLDLGFGQYKISFGRGSGGHKGLESVIRSVKTKNFVRIRVGASPMTPSGKVKKPKGEKKVVDFIMGSFNKKEQDGFSKLFRTLRELLITIIEEGRAVAMNRFN